MQRWPRCSATWCAVAPFDRLAWWQGLADHCGLDPLLAVARNGAGLAVLPLRPGQERHRRAGQLVHLPVPAAGHAGGRRHAPAARARRRPRRAQPHGSRSPASPAKTAAAPCSKAPSARPDGRFFRRVCDTNHTLQVSGRSFADYLAERPGQLQHHAAAQGRQARNHGAHPRSMPQAWAEYEAIYAESWKPHEGSPEFLRRFAGAGRRRRPAAARHRPGRGPRRRGAAVDGRRRHRLYPQARAPRAGQGRCRPEPC